VVYGVRQKREASFFMQAAYKLFYRVFHLLSYLSVPLDAGDFSLIDRRVVNAMNALPENNRFMRGLRAWAGFRQTGVPYVRPERMFGRTTNSFLRNLDWARKAIFSFSYAPLDLINWLAFFSVAGSFAAIALQLALRLFYPALAPQGFPTVIILVLFMGGIQLLCIGIIGSYLAHIYDEVKRRPPYVVESYINFTPGTDAKG
jgi:dolichol-phosphate mannosyltransferase